MSSSNNFTAWAIDRAEQIVSAQGLDLLRSASDNPKWTTDQCVVRLTMAIIEALIESRNFTARDAEDRHVN
ncbi:MAG: hypothetical protein KGI75_19475 [Rhizobiaceae bacterium]|nr:hypothetical protein [Rhizobiaceae bacterium]